MIGLQRSAVTLVETLVVIAIVALLMAMVVPAIQYVRSMSDSLSCKSNLRQITLALHHYHTDHGRIPPLPGNAVTDRLYSRASWRVQLLPYLEQEALWKEAVGAFQVTTHDWESPPHTGYSKVVGIYTCPTDSRLREAQLDSVGRLAGFSSYLGVSGAGTKRGMFGHFPGINFKSVGDGLSHTLFVGERPPPDNFMAGYWYADPGYSDVPLTQLSRMGPNHFLRVSGERILYETSCIQDFNYRRGTLDNPCDRGHFWSLHPGGSHFSLGDGSVRFFPYAASDTVNAMASRAGGEIAPDEP